MGALVWAQLVFLGAGSGSVEIKSEGHSGERWRAVALEATASQALEESNPGLQLIWRGRLDGTTLEYEASESPAGPVLAAGTIDLAGLSASRFAREVAKSVAGLGTGDSGDAPSSAGAGATARGPPAPLSTTALLFLLLAVLAISSPLFAFAPALVAHPLEALRERRSLRWTIAAWVVVGAIAVVARLTPESLSAWLVHGGGGIAWGVFATTNLRVVFPPFSGLGRIEHRDVFRLLRAWGLVALLRALRRAVFYAPFFVALWLALGALEVSNHFFVMVAVPVWGLLVQLWFLSLVENSAYALDRRLVVGEADHKNEWHEAIRGYYLGYVRRLGWADGDALADDVLFLPGRGDAITTYGGGLTHSRIIVGVELLELGLAPYGRPHDYEAPREDKLFWSDWHAGLIVPVRAGSPVASRAERTVAHHAEAGDEDAPLQLGQPPTLAGFVEPSALDSRLSHRPAEDPTWLEWDPGNNFDGTDPGDHDFLFGALVWKLGLIQRQTPEAQTLRQLAAPWTPASLARAASVLSIPYQLLFSRPQAELDDAFAAVNYARHHLIQYLAWQTWSDDAHITSRALAPELERQSDEIFETLAGDEQDDGGPRSLRRRLRYLASFGRQVDQLRPRGLRRHLALVIVGGAVVGLVASGVIRAINYQPPQALEAGAAAPASKTGSTP